MLPFDLSQYPTEARDALCMDLYRGLERLMADQESREYIERRTAEIEAERLKGGETR